MFVVLSFISGLLSAVVIFMTGQVPFSLEIPRVGAVVQLLKWWVMLFVCMTSSFDLRVFMLWSVRHNIIQASLGLLCIASGAVL